MMASLNGASIQEYMSSFTKLSKIVAGTLLGGFLLQLVVPFSKQYLALIPGRTLPFVYTVVTSGFLETELISAIAYAVGTLFLLRVVEPAYGSREAIKYLLSVLTATGTFTFLLVFLLYIFSNDQAKAGKLLYTEICGFHAGFAALLVSLKQLMPENEVSLLGGLGRLRAKHLAGSYVLLVSLLGVLTGRALNTLPFALFGAYFSWVYLRFWQARGDGSRGDLSEEFSLASSFFPEQMQPAVERAAAPFAAFTSRALGRSGDAAQRSQQQAAGGSSQQGRGHVLGGAAGEGAPESWDAARRRERGARALEERLGLQAGGASAGAPAAADGGGEGGRDVEEGAAAADAAQG